MPSVEKAQRRAAARNLESTGFSSSSPFSVLQDLPDSHLASVVHDVGLAFAVETGREAEVLSLIRAKEAAQAAIAEAVFRRDMEVVKAAATVPGGADGVVGATEEAPRLEAGIPSLAPPSAAPKANGRGTAKTKLAARRGRRKTAGA